jgi:hypothetical protein
MLLVALVDDSLSPGRLTPGTRRCSTGFGVCGLRRFCERCPRHLPPSLVHSYPFVFPSEYLLSTLSKHRLRRRGPLSTQYTGPRCSSLTRTPTRSPSMSSELFFPSSMSFHISPTTRRQRPLLSSTKSSTVSFGYRQSFLRRTMNVSSTLPHETRT